MMEQPQQLANVRMRALYDYHARNQNELSFKKGQQIFLITAEDDGWASGECLGVTGWFPISYVTPDTALTEISSLPPEQTKAGKGVETTSIMLQRTQTVSRMNEWVPNRPEPEDLEKRKILKPAAGDASKKAPPASSAKKDDSKKDDKKDKKKEEKKGGLMGLFGRGKKKDDEAPAAAPVTTTVSLASAYPPQQPHSAANANSASNTPAPGVHPALLAGGAPGMGGMMGGPNPVGGAGGGGPAGGAFRPARYFRVPIQNLPDLQYNHNMPFIVQRCVEYIRQHALDLEGIFRISGLASDIDKLVKQFEAAEYTGPLRATDPHAIAGVLKKFFRELPEPLFTIELHKQFIETLPKDKATQVAALRDLVERLPPVNKNVIQYLIPFLAVVSKHHERNMMNVGNLSIVFGPSLMRSSEENRTGMPDPTNRSAAVIEIMLIECDAIFGAAAAKDNQPLTTGGGAPTAPPPRKNMPPPGGMMGMPMPGGQMPLLKPVAKPPPPGAKPPSQPTEDQLQLPSASGGAAISPRMHAKPQPPPRQPPNVAPVGGPALHKPQPPAPVKPADPKNSNTPPRDSPQQPQLPAGSRVVPRAAATQSTYSGSVAPLATVPLMPVIRSGPLGSQVASTSADSVAKQTTSSNRGLPSTPMNRPPALTTAGAQGGSLGRPDISTATGSMLVISSASSNAVSSSSSTAAAQNQQNPQHQSLQNSNGNVSASLSVESPSVASSVSCPTLNQQTQAPAGVQAVTSSSAVDSQSNTKKYVRAMYEYRGDPVKGQLSFNKDDVITLIQTHDSGWWTGELRNVKGYFPSTFVAEEQQPPSS